MARRPATIPTQFACFPSIPASKHLDTEICVLIIIQIIESSDQPAKNKWPTDAEIDEITERMVINWVEQGNDATDLKLKKVLRRFNDCGFTGDFMVCCFN